jgi:hypothetical protein
METNYDAAAALALGRYLVESPEANLPNLDKGERSKVIKLMKNIEQIAEGNAKSPVSQEDAHGILVKIRIPTRVTPESGPIKRAFKKVTSPARDTKDNLKSAQKAMTEAVKGNSALQLKLKTTMPPIINSFLASQCKGFVAHAQAAKSDEEQAFELAKLKKDISLVTPQDVESLSDMWSKVIEELIKLEPKGQKSAKDTMDCILVLGVKLASVGAFITGFERAMEGVSLPKEIKDFLKGCMRGSGVLNEILKLGAPL